MNQQLTLVPTADLDHLRSEIRELREVLEGATIVPRPEWVSIPDAAKAKHVTPTTVRRWINEGKLKARGSGRAREVRLG